MQVLKFDEELHYKHVYKWWTSHKGWDPISIDILPPAGFIVEHAGEFLAAGWLYFGTDTPVGWFEWVVSNPKAGKIERGKALDLLIDTVLEYGDSHNMKVIFHIADNKPWINKLKAKQFNPAGDVTLLARTKEE